MNRQRRNATSYTSIRSDALRLLWGAGYSDVEQGELAPTAFDYRITYQGSVLLDWTATTPVSHEYTVAAVSGGTRLSLTPIPDGGVTPPVIPAGASMRVGYSTGQTSHGECREAGRVTGPPIVDTVDIDSALIETPSTVTTSAFVWSLASTIVANPSRDVCVDFRISDPSGDIYLREMFDFVATPLVNPCNIAEFLSRWPGFGDKSRLPYHPEIMLQEVWEELADRMIAAGLRPEQVISLHQFKKPCYSALAARLCDNGYYPGGHDDRTILREDIGKSAQSAWDTALSIIDAYDSTGDGQPDETPKRFGYVRLGR